MLLALPAVFFMLIVQGLALYQLFSPFYLWPPKITLPEDLLAPDEPLEYEVNLDPGPMGPTPAPKPAESSPEATESSQLAQTQDASSANAALVDTKPPPSPTQPSPANPSPAPPSQAQPSPAQMAAAVLSISRSTPAPQPLLAVEATPAPSAPDIVLVPSVDVAALSTTEAPAEERGAANGAPTNSDATSTPVRPLALEANAAPDRIAAAPISILPGVQAPVLEPVIVARPIASAARAIDRVPVDLTIAAEPVVLSEITAPAPAVDVAQPVRVKPELPKPDLRVEQTKPNAFQPVVPNAAKVVAAAQPVLSRADTASASPNFATKPDLAIDAAMPEITKPSAAAVAVARPVLIANAASKPEASESPSARAASNASSAAGKPGQSGAASGLPSDPFARAGTGKGPRDLLGQGLDAAAAQAGEDATNSRERGNAFRRYSDPFADDAPNPLAGLRLREPQLFNDVLKFLVKSFGAVANDGPGHSFSGPNGGVLMEQWIRLHHSDLQRECRVQQETIDEHVRRLLCGEL